mmetsp:Transcript_30078/g.53128  ORF Transcript_30078/g.53128 Transcript_30078/m.53128 type:complete len:351 (-) Transcript_30078:360-1412(-)
MSNEHLIRAVHNNANCAIKFCFKRVGVRSIFLRFLCHQPNIWTSTHGSRVESSILLAKLHNLIEHLAISSVRNGPEEVFLFVSGVPHLATTTNCSWQGVVNDDVARYMEVCDASTTINHCHLATFCVCGHDVIFNGLLLGIWQRCNFLVYIAQTVVGVHTKGGECVLVLGKDILEVYLHAMTKEDRVGDLHHRCLQMKREENIRSLCLLNALLVVVTKQGAVQVRSIQHLTSLQRQLWPKHRDAAICSRDVLNSCLASCAEPDGALVGVEVAIIHATNGRPRLCQPLAHAVRILESVLFDWYRSTTIRVSLAQNWIHRAAKDLCIARFDVLLFVILGFLGIVWNSKALTL